MPPELTVGEKTIPLKIHGTEEIPPETENKPPVENGEEVLTVEEFQQKYPNIKLKAQIGGEEVVKTPKEFVDYNQRYQGLERTSERKAQETARLLAEVKEQVRELKTQTAPPAEPEDPNNPEHFVKGIVRGEVEPKFAAIDHKLNTLLQTLEPELEEAQIKRAKNILKANEIDPADFDDFKEPVLRYFEKKIGRDIEPSEMAQIPAAAWVQGYAFVKLNSKPKAELKPKVETEPKIIVKREGPSGGGGGYPRVEATTSRELEEAQRTGDFSKLIMKRIKPRPQGE